MSQQGDLIGGRYRLEEHLGSGGMGHVWLAWDERLSRAVALKQLRAVPDLPQAEVAVAHERAMREARLTARLDHPNAVRVYDVVDHQGEPCLVMQYVPSRSLHELLSSDGALPPRRVARLGVEMASALAAAHAAHIVHRDVKPGNVLVTVDGTALITDFGISRAFGDAALTSTGLLTGTPAYLAPEIARGEGPTPSSDVFSLGSTLYTAVEGIPPFGVGENPMALLHQVAQGRITPPTQAGPLTDTLVAMLDPDPRPRPTMEQVALALAQVEAAAARELAPTVPQTRHSTAVLPVTPQPFEEEVEPDTGNLAPTPAAVPVRAPAPDPAPPPAREADVVDPRRRRRRRALGLGAVAVLLVLLTAWALSNLTDPSGGPAPPIAASSTTPGRPALGVLRAGLRAVLRAGLRADVSPDLRESQLGDAPAVTHDALRERVAPTCHAGPLHRCDVTTGGGIVGRDGRRPEPSRAQLLRPGARGHGCRLGAAHGPLPPHDRHESGLLRAVLVQHRRGAGHRRVEHCSLARSWQPCATAFGTVAPSWSGPPTGSCERTAG